MEQEVENRTNRKKIILIGKIYIMDYLKSRATEKCHSRESVNTNPIEFSLDSHFRGNDNTATTFVSHLN